MQVEETEHGGLLTCHSICRNDRTLFPESLQLIQAHADVVTKFVEPMVLLEAHAATTKFPPADSCRRYGCCLLPPPHGCSSWLDTFCGSSTEAVHFLHYWH